MEEVEEIKAEALQEEEIPVLPKSSYRPKPNTSNPAHLEQVRELQCAVAAVNKENMALRQYSEWQTRRIQFLEEQLSTLTN